MPIYQNLYQTLLPCPIVELRGYLAACGLRGRLYAYLDYNGPTGTARDNLAEGMLALADERGALKPGQPCHRGFFRSLCAGTDAGRADGGPPCGADHAGGRPGPAAGAAAAAGSQNPPCPGPRRAFCRPGAGQADRR